ncbi:MAG: glycosidase [candidate division Zixibacteria bacterium]|nr:glycosidase [candidate division Zixibacteria bacterium]
MATEVPTVKIINDQSGSKLQVNGADFMIKGMNWGYIPIGKNYAYSLWTQSDDFIMAALAREMPLLQNMGVNTIRHYVGIPPRWVKYIYETYGIYTVVNHPLGRYGLTLNGVWTPITDYSDPTTRAVLMAEMEALVAEFDGTPGMLFWLLGNENNYGLEWSSAETEALPEGERRAAKARYLYTLFGDVTDMIKSRDPGRPVAMANGDLQYIDIIAEELSNLDILGSNVYRGISARDAFEVVKEKMGIPYIFTEFGADAFNAKTLQEDQQTQARYLIGQWQEIYEQSHDKGRIGNACGGFTFQFSDGWWKYKQEENLDIHDINASWPNGGYQEDLIPGENNMNEEWWGICAKGFPDASGLYQLYPRAAYYALKKAYTLDPYGPSTSLETIRAHFSKITPMGAALEARGNKAALTAETGGRVRVSRAWFRFETISTGGINVTTPKNPGPPGYPAFQGFDHLESYYTEIEAKPSGAVRGTLALNYIGHVPENPIDEIFYENRGRVQAIVFNNGEIELKDIERLKVYSASVSWAGRLFDVEGFYRTGHYHWGYEGDFFGLYREANYGPNIDIYNGEAPLGLEFTGKKNLNGLKFAIGPELWWGANPAALLKYQRRIGSVLATGIYQHDLADQTNAVTSTAIPLPKTKKATLHLEINRGPLTVELGGIWSGDNKVGQPFQFVKGTEGNYEVLQDSIESKDAFGGKFKLSYSMGSWLWYLQGASMGLVADGGPTLTQTYSDWWLKESGKGNQRNLITGVSTRFGNLEVSPNFLWQKPLKGPMPADVPQPGHPRNVRDDAFAVRENREMVAGEIVITYDPTPATWMYLWDSDIREDAKLAATFGLIIKHYKTTMDAALFFDSAAGNPIYPFPGATPARDVWEARARIVSKLRPDFSMIANLYAGKGEPHGDDPRLIDRYGADVRLISGSTRLQAAIELNDWGPYDYHRDHNLTFPIQLYADISTFIGKPEWFALPQTRLGVKAIWRSLDEYSSRYRPTSLPGPDGPIPNPDADDGNEWEIRTYLHLYVGN